MSSTSQCQGVLTTQLRCKSPFKVRNWFVSKTSHLYPSSSQVILITQSILCWLMTRYDQCVICPLCYLVTVHYCPTLQFLQCHGFYCFVWCYIFLKRRWKPYSLHCVWFAFGLNQKNSCSTILVFICEVLLLNQYQNSQQCMCVYDQYVVSFSSSHIQASHALSMQCVVAFQHEIRGYRRHTAALDVRWCVISFFFDLFERASLRSLPLGAFWIFHDSAMYLFTLKYVVN